MYRIFEVIVFILLVICGVILGWIPCILMVVWEFPQLICYSIQAHLSDRHSDGLKNWRYGPMANPKLDYRQKSGKAVIEEVKEKSWKDKQHAKLGMFPHGEKPLWNDDYGFKETDRAWLTKELEHQKWCEKLNESWRWTRACLKGSIPIFGFVWIWATETGLGGGSQIGCSVCQLGGEADHWTLPEALKYHLEILDRNKRLFG